MPAAKHVQLNSPSDVNGHYANDCYPEGGYQQQSQNFNRHCWAQNSNSTESQPKGESYAANRNMKKWVLQEAQSPPFDNGFHSCGNYLIHNQETQQKLINITGRELCHGENNPHSKGNHFALQDSGGPHCFNQSLHSDADWYESAAQNEYPIQGYGLNQSEMYEKYPFCSSFKPSSDHASRLCCNDKPHSASSNTACIERINPTSSDVFLPSYHDPRQNNRVCTQQPRSATERMSQVDLAIEHCRQAEAKQLYSFRNEENVSNHFEDRSGSANFTFDRIAGSNNHLINGENQSQLKFRQMTNSEVHTNNSLLHAQCLNHPLQNCHEPSDCVVEDRMDSKYHHSVSSDPEIYTKTPSVEKLNSHIQKLREEMLALRSTTLLYKDHMEKMFHDLRIITRMNEGNTTSPETTYRTFIEKSTNHNSANNSSLSHVRLPVAKNGSLTKVNPEGETTASQSTTPSSQDKSEKIPSRILPSYENVMDARLRTPQPPKPAMDSDNNIVKRSKTNERPTSDPFCASNKNNAFSANTGGPISTMSLPHTQSSNKHPNKSVKSSSESDNNRSKGYNDQLRILPVLSKSNAALHISECSIDSGYQGSSITSPREKQGRDLGSQAVTPASPISESPVQQESEPEVKKDSSAAEDGLTDSCESGKSPNIVIMSPTILPLFIETKTKQAYSCNDGGSLKDINDESSLMGTSNSQDHAKASFQLPKIEKMKSYDGPSIVIKNNEPQSTVVPKALMTSNGESEDPQIRHRPVPKQRTVFTLIDKPDKATPSNQVCLSKKVKPEETTKVLTENQQLLNEQHFQEASRLTELQSSKSTVKEMKKNENRAEEHSRSVRPTPPTCLSIIKRSSQTSNDTGSPVQSRVKLGVSSIKQYTPNSESKEGPIFYYTGQVSKPSDVSTRFQKTTNTKKLLREKFSVAVENSSSSALDNASETADADESSMVRRRSMRMMTEFQIFDLKDAMGSIDSPNACDKSFNKLNIPNNPKYLSSSVSNRLSKSTSSSSYSVSPSAATVSKEIFDGEVDMKLSKIVKPVSSSLRKTKLKASSNSATDRLKDHKTGSSSYAEQPFPPQTLPQSPSAVNENPPQLRSSRISLLSEAELGSQELTNDAFQAPLIRPKPSLPGVSCDTGPPEVPVSSLNGLKISSKARSAFTPVLSGSSASLATKSSPVSCTQDDFPNDGTTACELQRRVSLPTSFISNKQRFLKEFMPNSLEYERNCILKPGSGGVNSAGIHIPSFHRMSEQKKKDITTITTTDDQQRSYAVLEENNLNHNIWKKQPFKSTELLFSEIPKKNTYAANGKERRRQASSDKMNFPFSSDHGQNLECVPVPFNRSDRMADVIGGLQNTFPSNKNNNKIQQDVKVSNNNARHTKEDYQQSSYLQLSSTRPVKPNDLGQLKPHHKKSSSSSAIHQYMIDRPADLTINDDIKVKTSSNVLGHKQASSREKIGDNMLPRGGATEQKRSPTRSHKSTVAMIKASLLGKREKHTRSTTAEGKKDAHMSKEHKSRSASAGAKNKTTADLSSGDTLSAAKSKCKDSKSKKNTHESKENKVKPSASKKNTRDQYPKIQEDKSKKQIHPELDLLPTSPTLPNVATKEYDPGSEAMERFLTTAAAASETPKSPLQRLRSSFRAQKNKTKLLNSSRIKDDMDVARIHSINLGSQFDKTFPHGQEFTYV